MSSLLGPSRRATDAFRQDFGYALRALIRSPGLTATIIITLGLAAGANAAGTGGRDGDRERASSMAGDARKPGGSIGG
jgi:hypothetical protein